jgi:hypothetical protein
MLALTQRSKIRKKGEAPRHIQENRLEVQPRLLVKYSNIVALDPPSSGVGSHASISPSGTVSGDDAGARCWKLVFIFGGEEGLDGVSRRILGSFV